MRYVGPFAFNGIRFLLGSLSLLPLVIIRGKGRRADSKTKTFLFSAFLAGTCLFVAVTFQQLGMIFTTAGNAGFITGIYVVLTPIFGIFLGRKTGPATWLGSVFTLAGLYFICAVGKQGFNPGDIIVLASAVFWACHVLLIDRLVQNIDPIELSSGQFAVCGILMLIGTFLAEPFIMPVVEKLNPALLETGTFSWLPLTALISGISAQTIAFPVDAIIPILYGGLGSVGIAYTLQAVAQRDAPPAHATIILCFEGCFAAIGGALLLSEKVGIWTLLGFFLMLAGMLVTQWEVVAKK